MWTDGAIRDFIRQYYAWFLPIYDAYPVSINRAEAFRYFVLYHYGGVYADLDLECLRPLDGLLEGKEVVLGQEPQEHSKAPSVRQRGLEQLVCNAFLASTKGHPFWEHVWRYLVKFQNAPGVLDATSIFLLTRAYNAYPQKDKIQLITSDLLYPLSKFESREVSQTERSELAARAYTIHYWHGSWWREATLKSVRKRILEKHSHADE